MNAAGGGGGCMLAGSWLDEECDGGGLGGSGGISDLNDAIDMVIVLFTNLFTKFTIFLCVVLCVYKIDVFIQRKMFP
jgi:hypothetical protein